MKLSIIIVNYNVKYFLEQTLQSVFRSVTDFEYEVIVVDNNSQDGSMAMVQARFPQVTTICNSDNRGFSKANNQGISISTGQYLLLLNPDTILSEETLQVCVEKMDSDSRIGGLGVRMIDGGGNFLPESKRGLPTPFVAFCKAFGLSRLFPTSERFNYYHLGHIPEHQSSEVDVLSGAFMMMRHDLIREIGGLDETFFMYGEDIDMSYRIQKAGLVNWYESDTSIIHFKGESTKRGSLNYVKVFYKAMIIFAKKHFVGNGAFLMSLLYQLAVFLRAGLSLGYSVIKWMVPVLVDGLIIFGGLQLLARLWANYYFDDPNYYQSVPLVWHHLLYSVVWLSTMFVGGVYDKYYKLRNLHRSLLLGSVVLLLAFSLMSSEWRPSRAIVVLGAGWSLVSLSVLRWFVAKIQGVKEQSNKRMAIVGSQEEILRTRSLLEMSSIEIDEVVEIAPNDGHNSKTYKGLVGDLEEVVEAYQVDEVIFCARDIENAVIMKWMTRFSGRLPIKIIQEEGAGVIGSRYKHKKGEWYAIDARLSIAQPERKRQKRLVDIILCVAMIPATPFLLFQSGGKHLLSEWWSVLSAKKTWVAYEVTKGKEVILPGLKMGVVSPSHDIANENVRERVDYLYAKDYSPWMDFELFWKYLMKEE